MKALKGLMGVVLVAAFVMLSAATPAMAQADGAHDAPAVAAANFLDTVGAKAIGGGLGAGLVVLGGAMGIGRIGGSAVESMARQPEVAGRINTAMIITAAMIEGATLFAVLGCFLALIAS